MNSEISIDTRYYFLTISSTLNVIVFDTFEGNVRAK